MGDIVNLRQARKRKARTDKAQEADANRAKFGQTKGERQAQADAAARRETMLAGHKRERKDEE